MAGMKMIKCTTDSDTLKYQRFNRSCVTFQCWLLGLIIAGEYMRLQGWILVLDIYVYGRSVAVCV